MLFKKFILCGLFSIIAIIKIIEAQQTCQTPSGSVGHCVPFNSCDSLRQMVKKDWLTPAEKMLINKSWCDTSNGVRTICCPYTRKRNETAVPYHRAIDYSNHPNAKLIQLRQCGKASTGQITDELTTEPFEFPWMAMIRVLQPGNRLTVLCGGTLISDRYVLTAGHCLHSILGDIDIHSVVLGEHDTNTNPDCIAQDCADVIQEIPVEKSIPHPQFNLANANNDIGLLRLKWSTRLSDSVMPICLPYTVELQNKDLKKVIVTGWGATEKGAPSANALQKAILDVMPNSECSRIYIRASIDQTKFSVNFMCAFNEDSHTCEGDSGGPGVFSAQTEFGARVIQYGIVSAGTYSCGSNNSIPSLYTRVSNHIQWILDNISV